MSTIRLIVVACVIFYFWDSIRDWGMFLFGIAGRFLFWALIIAFAIWLAH